MMIDQAPRQHPRPWGSLRQSWWGRGGGRYSCGHIQHRPLGLGLTVGADCHGKFSD